MAYKLLDLKLTPGSLNLAAPGDQIPETDCLVLTGWWQSSAGRLVQGMGFTYLSALHNGVGLDSVCQVGTRTYFGGGTPGAGKLYQVGRAGEAALYSTYDGLPLGMISFQGYLWVMNKNHAHKDDGTTLSDWTPANPAAPTVTNPGLTSASVAISECDPVVTTQIPNGNFTQVNVFTIGDATGDVLGTQVGGSITITGNVNPIYNHTWTVAQVSPGSKNNAGVNIGQALVVVTASLSKDALPSPIGSSGSYTFAAPGVVPGSHVYYITWQYADLGESNPSPPVTVKVPSNGSKVTISIAGLTVPAGTTGWNVYRQSPAMSWPYVVNAKVIPIATTSYDDFGDAAHSQDNTFLTDDLGQQLEFNHDAAPAASVIANQIYNGRIVVANSTAYPNRIWYTPALQPGFFRGSANPNGGDWVDVGTDRGDAIMYIAVKPQQLIVYRQKSIWRILYDFEDINSRIEVVVPELGTVGFRSVACSSQGDYFRAPEGIYKFNGDWAAKMSAKIDPVFVGLANENFAIENPAAVSNCALGLHAGRLWVSYTYGSGPENDSSFIYDTATDRWFDRLYGFDAFLDNGHNLIGAMMGYVVTLETGYQDGIPNQVLLDYQSAYQDCGLPDHEKTYADLVIRHNTQGQVLVLGMRTNKHATATDAFYLEYTLSSTTPTTSVIPLLYPSNYTIVPLQSQPIRATSLGIRIRGTGPDVGPPVSIEAPILMHYYIEARNGRIFDTDETDHGMPGVAKVVSEVEFDIDSRSGPGVLQIFSDIPGGAMAPRLGAGLGVPIAQTTTRQLVRIVITPTIDGKLLRYVATTTTGFNVYGFRARVTPIGVYVDGSITEVWDHRATPVGI